MASLMDVYRLADEHSIKVYSFDLDGIEALSLVSRKGRCRVAIDPMMLTSERDEKEKLIHEISHCITGSFYTEYDNAVTILKCEARAERFSFKWQIKYNELMGAVEDGCTEIWEIAEYFDVPEDTVRKAVEYYKAGNR